MKKSNILLFFTLALILLLGCKADKIIFQFEGREVLFSAKEGKITKLILMNIDTGKQIELNYFDKVEESSFHLYDQGKKIFVDPHNSSFFIIYDIHENDGTKIYHKQQSELTLDYFDSCIYDDTLYTCGDTRITSYSLKDYNIIKEYNTNSEIFDFEVIAPEQFAVIHSFFNSKEQVMDFSNIVLYDFINSIHKKDLNIKGMMIKSSRDGRYLYFVGSEAYYLYSISDSTMRELKGFNQDSIKVHYEIACFINNDTLIFAGESKEQDKDFVDLYLYDLNNDQISKRLTYSGIIDEIKDTYYNCISHK